MAGAIRGLREELGIEDVSLERVSEVIGARLDITELGIKDHELQVCYRGVSDAELVPEPNEVANIRLFELDDLEAAMRISPDDFTPWFRCRAQDIGLFE